MNIIFGTFSSSQKFIKKIKKKKCWSRKLLGYCPAVSRYSVNCIVTWWFWKAVEWLSNYIAIHQSVLQECAVVGGVLQHGVGWKVVLQ